MSSLYANIPRLLGRRSYFVAVRYLKNDWSQEVMRYVRLRKDTLLPANKTFAVHDWNYFDADDLVRHAELM